MLRIASCLAFLGAVWLASTALPESDGQRRLNAVVGITLAGNPDAEAINTTRAYNMPIYGTVPARRDQPVRKYKAQRSAAHVFGLEPIQVAATDADTKRQPSVAAKAENDSAPDDVKLPPSEHRTLVRHIQRELRRVGCYSGTIDGVWGRGSRNGLTKFARKISAPVTIDKPDYVALMLIETYNARACGSAPKAILARAKTEPEPKSAPAKVTAPATRIASTAPTLPTASPARFTRNRIVVAKRIAAPLPAAKPALLTRPQVAGVRTRSGTGEKTNSRTALAQLRKKQATERTRTRKAERRARIRTARLKRARRIASARHRANVRARANARRRASAKQRRRAQRRYARSTPKYGFRSSRRAWVRQAFTSRR